VQLAPAGSDVQAVTVAWAAAKLDGQPAGNVVGQLPTDDDATTQPDTGSQEAIVLQ
jgi:hypothetical protein